MSAGWSNQPKIFGTPNVSRTLLDCLPVLAYIDAGEMDAEKRLLWLPAVFPSEAIFYDEDVTAVRLRFPGIFARHPINLPQYQKDVRLRFRPSPNSQTQEVCGVVTSINFTKSANPNANDAQIQVIFSGKGSALKINSLLEGLKKDNCFSSVSHDYEYQKEFRNQQGEVVGIANGPRRNNMEPANSIDASLRSSDSVDCAHRLNAELLAYFNKEADSVMALKVVLDSFGTDEVLSRMSQKRVEAELAAIIEKERLRIERVANSMKRRRVIVVRNSVGSEPEPERKPDLTDLVDTTLLEKPSTPASVIFDSLSKISSSAMSSAKAFETFGSIFKHK